MTRDTRNPTKTTRPPVTEAKVGDKLGTMEFTITEEELNRRAWGIDDYNPWYMEDSPFGGRVAPPSILIHSVIRGFLGYYDTGSGGVLHTKDEIDVINPLRIGKKLKLTSELVARYERKGRDFFTAECLVAYEDGVEVARIRYTHAIPVIARKEG